ncbi:recombinase RecT [Cupriavidus necator]|nr:recombinase RecT [Cupriavidus necator]
MILPGIGLYRTMAARTGCYAGMTEPEFGPNEILGYRRKVWEENPTTGKSSSRWVDEELTYPAWCKITVRKIVAGVICDFTAVEYWLENYATSGRDTDAPNEMWRKRVRGQLAKVAESQALRKAFPEVGALPTAEEMEGRVIDLDSYQAMSGRGDGEHEAGDEPRASKPLPRRKSEVQQAELQMDPEPKHEVTDVPFTESQPQAEAKPTAQPARRQPAPEKSADASPVATAGMLGLLRVKAKQGNLTEADLMKRAGVDAFERLTIVQVNGLLAWIANPQE